jgi:hypothetical protein
MIADKLYSQDARMGNHTLSRAQSRQVFISKPIFMVKYYVSP